MRTILIALLLCLVTLSYGQWNSQTSGVTTGLNDVHFEDSNTGWAVGAAGTIIKTTNGGNNWTALTSGVSNQINSVFFTSITNGAIVGSGGLVSVTFNSGNTWFKQITGYTSDFRDVFFTDMMTAFIVGDAGKILKSTDGGLTWVSKPNGASVSDVLWSIWFTDANTGWAVGGNFASGKSLILKTTDAGESWVSQLSPTTDWFYSVSFGDGNNGWAAGPNGNIAKTSNGGSNWNLQTSGTATEWFYSSYAIDAQKAFAGGGSGLIAATTDGGANWVTQTTGVTSAIRSFYFVDSNTGWAVGDGGTILKRSNASLSLLTPDGGEVWKAGTNQNITWSSSGIANLKIEYSLNNGANWNIVNASTPASTGHYTWAVPAATSSTQTIIRISDATNSAIKDQSTNTITIVNPSISVSAPNGGERWKVGKTQNITWISSDIANIKIEYSIDDRATWKTLVATVPAAAGSYPWIIPDEPTLQAVVKISDVVDNLITDDSNAPFHIEKPSLNLVSPNGGENWLAGSVQNITWNSANVSKVSLNYSIDNGVTWTGIVTNISATPGNYSWTIPNFSSNQALVKVYDFDDDKLADQSDAVFTTYIPTIALTSPNGGERWRGGSSQNITWTSNHVTDVKLEFSADNGATWSEIIANTPAAPGSFNGTVPTINTNQGLVRISDIADNKVVDVSDATFSIFLPSITLNSPNGGESWKVGSVQTISWTSENIQFVKLEYSVDNGVNWLTIINSTPALSEDHSITIENSQLNEKISKQSSVKSITGSNTGSYSWTIPNSITSQALVKVSDVIDDKLNDRSDAAFRIFNKSIIVLTPNGGENWKAGTSQTISWISTNVPNVKIEYTTNSGTNWIETIASTPANLAGLVNYFSWIIPNTVSNNCKVRITDVGEPLLSDTSNSQFTIYIPTLTLTFPNGGEKLKVGSTQNIKWISKNVSNIKIEYSTNNGANWLFINSNIAANAGSYSWIVPDTRTSQAVIRITDVSDNLVGDRSDANFRITKPQISLLTPIGGENIRALSNYLLEWETIDIAKVKVEFTTNDGSSWNSLTSSINTPLDATYNYNWQTPNLESQACKVKITDLADLSNYAICNSTFSIFKSSLQVLTPNGGERIKAGSKFNITWTSNKVNKIDISYTTDGVSSRTIASNIDASLGSYEWNVPNLNSTTCKIIILDLDYPTLVERSNADFFVYNPKITIVSPNGGEKFKVGSSQNITWNSESVSSVKIEYSVNNGTTWKLIAPNVPASPPSYGWVVPDDASAQVLVRVSDSEDQVVNDVSNTKFNIIKPSITLRYPNGGEDLKVGLSKTITWESSDVERVKIEYSTNNGSTWKLITANTPTPYSPISYGWTIPNEITSQALIKITSLSDLSIFGITSNTFTISKGSITLLSPNNGVFQAEKNYNITWQSVGVSKVKIEYWNGLTWSEIANNIDASLGFYNWLTPGVSNVNKIKISDVDYLTNYVESSANFRIASLKIVFPNGGERLQWGVQTKIRWTDSDLNKSGKSIEISEDNGQNWKQIGNTQDDNGNLLNVLNSEGSIKWIPYGNLSAQYKVRVKDHYQTNMTDEGDGTYEVYKQPIALTQPNGGESFQAKDKITIVFNTASNTTNVNLDYTYDNGNNWNRIVSNYDVTEQTLLGIHYYIWEAPRIYSNNFKIRVTDSQNIQNFDIGDSTFTIKERRLDIIYPTKGIVCSPNNSFSVIVKKTYDNKPIWVNVPDHSSCDQNANTGFQFPHNINSDEIIFPVYVNYCRTKDFLVSVYYEDQGVRYEDEISVKIKPQPFNIKSPINNQRIDGGKELKISWDLLDPSIQKCKIEFFSSQGNVVISDNYLASIGEFIWQVPESFIGIEQASLTISDASMPTYSTSKSGLKIGIYRELIVESPNLNTVWKSGTEQLIKWKSLNISRIKIEYYDNLLIEGSSSVGYWRTIATINSSSSPLNNGSYLWLTPTIYYRSRGEKIRISNADDLNMFVTIDPFTIQAMEIRLMYGLSLELKVGDVYVIQWNSVNIDTVNIDYSIDEGITWLPIEVKLKNNSAISLTDQGSGLNTYRWKIPNNPSSKVKFRIIDANDPTNYDVTDTVSTILRPEIKLIQPIDGAKLISNKETFISWESKNLNTVDIEYSTNNGTTWNLIEENYSSHSGQGYCSWFIPNLVSANCKVRISVAGSRTIFAQNNSPFSIEQKTRPYLFSSEWNSDFNYREGQGSKPIISDLILTNQNTKIKSAIIRIKKQDADSISRRYHFDYDSSPVQTDYRNYQELILNGSFTPEEYIQAIKSIKFSYSGDPHNLDGVVYNTLSLQVFDGIDSSIVLTRPMTFTSVNSTPVIADNSGNILNYTIGAPPLKIVPNLSISDDVNLRGKATLEVSISDNYIKGEDLIGAEPSLSITSSFLVDNAKFKLNDNYAAPKEIMNNAKTGLYYLVENGTKSIGKTKKLEIQYFDDYQAASNKLTKSVTIKAPEVVNPNLKPPETVKIEHITGGNIRVSWTDRSGVAKGFIIYRTTNKVGKVSASYVLLDEDIIGIVPAEQLAFVDKTTEEGFTYSYRIASYNETGLSDISTQAPVVVNSVIKPPTNLSYKMIAYNTIQLSWEDNSEVEEGFVLEAKHDTSSAFKEVIKLNKNLTSFNVYNFIYNRNYRFRLKAFNSNTTSDESNVLEIKLQPTDAEELGFLPTEFALYQNYPNPFNPITTINYHLPTASQVSIKVYDMLGREVAVLVNYYQNPGLYSIEINSKYYNLGSGMYFYQIKAGAFTETKKMILLK